MKRTGATLINRDYTRLWAGQAVSSVGDSVFTTTLVLWIGTRIARGRDWAPAAVSGLMLAVSVAALTIGPLAGVFVDRWNRRHTMLATELVRGTLVGALAALSFLPADSLPAGVWITLIYATVLVVTCMGLLFNPARFATVTDIVEGQADRARAAGIGQATTSAALIIGPPLSAPLFFTVGFQWALVFNALSYFWSWAAIRSVRKPDTSGGTTAAEGAGFREELVAGFRYAGTNRFLRAMLVVAVICAFGTGPLNALDVFFTTENLHVRANLYGVMSMAIGIGSIVGALAAGRVVHRLGARATTWSMLLVAGAVFLFYARQTHFAAALVLYGVCGFAVTLVNTAIGPLIMGSVPSQFLGRVMALFAPAVELAQMLSAVLAGWLASSVLIGYSGSFGGLHMGRMDVLFSGGAVLIMLGGLYAYRSLPPDTAPEPAGPSESTEPAATPDGSALDDDRRQHQPVLDQPPTLDPA